MSVGTSRKIALTDLSRKLDLLAAHAHVRMDKLSTEMQSYFKELATSFEHARDDPTMYNALYNTLVNKFSVNGQFIHEYEYGTLGDNLIACSSLGTRLPSDIRACIKSCRDGVKPQAIPTDCTYRVWEEINGNIVPGEGNPKGPDLIILTSKRDLSAADR